ncbi:MAG: HNH endonuclease [Candidatus Eremiobacteraeota bacterium]|nr:HNH endonuclease [Candidatus Eremiobacteraeota bacterium]MBV8339218.1 HNH endonuclease [Candidatus Eremiobacteraeota bacterium]MBV8433509.1 HNH endonuclease [Candidatus Eremiobacteraeota bacterium]
MGRVLHDWAEIQRYHDEGHGLVECQARFGFSHTAWVKAIKRGRLRTRPTRFADRRRKHDWAKVQAYYDAGFTYRECLIRFSISPASWSAAIKRRELTARSRALPLDVMFAKNMSRTSIKRRLLELGILEECCARCGSRDWHGRRLAIHIDHVNGVKDDWRLENLRMLCPNCHSQTPTFSARNLRNPLRKTRVER